MHLRRLSALAPQLVASSFASGFSEASSLSVAVVEAVEQVKMQLGEREPHLLQLLVSTQPYGRVINLAPAVRGWLAGWMAGWVGGCADGRHVEDVASAGRERSCHSRPLPLPPNTHTLQFVHECFMRPGSATPPPVLLGGGVEAVLAVRPAGGGEGGGDSHRAHCGPGVSLLAAHLPGMALHPFHVDEPVAPELTPQQWRALLVQGGGAMSGSSSSSDRRQEQQEQQQQQQPRDPHPPLSALLLAEPHFVHVEQLLARLQGLLPSMSLLGGVLAPGPPQPGSTGEEGEGAGGGDWRTRVGLMARYNNSHPPPAHSPLHTPLPPNHQPPTTARSSWGQSAFGLERWGA